MVSKAPFYKQNWLIALTLIFLSPLGVFLWYKMRETSTNKLHSLAKKITSTGLILFWSIMTLGIIVSPAYSRAYDHNGIRYKISCSMTCSTIENYGDLEALKLLAIAGIDNITDAHSEPINNQAIITTRLYKKINTRIILLYQDGKLIKAYEESAQNIIFYSTDNHDEVISFKDYKDRIIAEIKEAEKKEKEEKRKVNEEAKETTRAEKEEIQELNIEEESQKNTKSESSEKIDVPVATESDKSQKETKSTTPSPAQPQIKPKTTNTNQSKFNARVVRVVDGDTIDVVQNGKTMRLRLIGLDTPETVDPRKPVQCFGKEASARAKELLLNKMVRLEKDPTQGDTDKYNRYLRYVFLENGANFALAMIREGYAHEYTYNTPYKYQAQFKAAQTQARNAKKGLWSPSACNGNTSQTATTPKASGSTSSSSNKQTPSKPTQEKCTIKGNINSKGEKIYHVVGGRDYNKTVIDTSKGERYFCTEAEAVKAGWRKSKS